MEDRVIYFGKYRGKDVRLIPSSYLVWLHNTINMDLTTELKTAVEQEIIRRFKMMDHSPIQPEHDCTEWDLY